MAGRTALFKVSMYRLPLALCCLPLARAEFVSTPDGTEGSGRAGPCAEAPRVCAWLGWTPVRAPVCCSRWKGGCSSFSPPLPVDVALPSAPSPRCLSLGSACDLTSSPSLLALLWLLSAAQARTDVLSPSHRPPLPPCTTSASLFLSFCSRDAYAEKVALHCSFVFPSYSAE